VEVHEKNGLSGGFSRAPYARVWWGIREPFLLQKKKLNYFGIAGDAISRCLEGLTCTLQSPIQSIFISGTEPIEQW